MNSIELKYPIFSIEKGEKIEKKYLTPSRFKMKHMELLPASLIELVSKNSTEEKIEMKFSIKDMLPIFSDMIPFLAAIFEVSEEAIKDIDFEDIENVLSCLEQVFPDDEKKN